MADPPMYEHHHKPKFTELNDLASEKVGGKILFSTDDWFAEAENLLKPEPPVWKEGVFTEFGKWMDGWETRRKRIAGWDWCVAQLGIPGIIHGIDVDTSYFTGNFAPRCSVQAACLDAEFSGRGRQGRRGSAATEEQFQDINRKSVSENWEEIVPVSQLQPGYKTTCHNYFETNSKTRFTHMRLNMYPDGGIARLRVYGRAAPNWERIEPDQLIDLVAMENGGMCIGYSDAHFGQPRNLIQPGRAEIMADGWETARKATRPAILQANEKGILQVPGDDWCVFRLGHPGTITKIEIDTNHFKGNFPDSCRIEGCNIPEDKETETCKIHHAEPWRIVLPATKLEADNKLFIDESDINKCGVVSHVRLTIAPDGGISRLRLWGFKEAKECEDEETSKKMSDLQI